MKPDKIENIPLSQIDEEEIKYQEERVDSDREIFFEAACLNKIESSKYKVIIGLDVIKWAKSIGANEIPAIVKDIDQKKSIILSDKLKMYKQLGSPYREMTIIGEMSEDLKKSELKEVFPEELVELHFKYQGDRVEIPEPEDEDDGNPTENNHDELEVISSEIDWDNKKQKEEFELVRKATDGSSKAEKIHKWAMTYLRKETSYKTPRDVLGDEDV